MNRTNGYGNNYSSASLNKQSMRRSHMAHNSTTMAGFHPRTPLYPIGPSLTQPNFRPMERGYSPSPYLKNPNIRQPSYEQRYLKTENLNINSVQGKISLEDREAKLINRNELEIQQQHRKKEELGKSFQREIQRINKILVRNMERKQKLISEIEKMQAKHSDLHDKLMGLHPPKTQVDTFQPLDRKQQEIIIMKGKLVTKMREKEGEFHKEEQEEEKYWEEQINQKEKIILNLQEQTKNRRIQAFKTRQIIQKPDLFSIEDQVRSQRYQEFVFQAEDISGKIRRYTQEREKLLRDVTENLVLKKPQLHNQRIRHQELNREQTRAKIRMEQLERVGKEMQIANQNLMREQDRKESMIGRYELDIHQTREKKQQQERQLAEVIGKSLSKNRKEFEFLPDIGFEINRMSQAIRKENSENSKLKHQYQKLYELLCSSASRNIRTVFNESLSV